MTTPYQTQATAQEIKPGETMCPIPIAVNDRAATREAIIRNVQTQGGTFIERSSWGAVPGNTEMEQDWDYSMIALHHAGRSESCAVGEAQMQAIQNFHLKKQFDDIGYHYGIDCNGNIYEGRDIRYKGSHVLFFNTGVVGIVLLEDLTTPEEGDDLVSLARVVRNGISPAPRTIIPAPQIDALLNLITALKSVFLIQHFGGHREYPKQASEGKICPGNIGMELVSVIRTQTDLNPPPSEPEQK